MMSYENEILNGLRASQKNISSKFLYDKKGSLLFNRITELPEYYLTRCEKEILREQGDKIAALIGSNVFHLVELGPGDGSKAQILIEQLSHTHSHFDYHGVDISDEGLHIVKNQLSDHFPDLDVSLHLQDYSRALNKLKYSLSFRKVVLFLGSSVGNMERAEAKKFIADLSENLNEGDLLIVGYDLKKEVQVLERAYNDSAGLTSEFNLNLLDRLNRELGANFERSHFYHLEHYNDKIGAMVSYIVSKVDQVVQIGSESIPFKKDERIHTEYSFKYDEKDILEMIQGTGLKALMFLKDSKKYFTSAIFEKTGHSDN